jgi:biopolymer transport protein ExbB
MDVTMWMVKLALSGAAAYLMWFMVLLSVISITIVLERYVFFTRNAGDPGETEHLISTAFSQGTAEDAAKALAGRRGLDVVTILAGLRAVDRGVDAVEEVMTGAMKVERLRYERGLAILGTLGNNAPFIGLLGTVIEIIRALHEMGEKTGIGAAAVMGRLSEALAATAVGLLVALPAVAAYNYFQRRIKLFATSAEALMHTLKGYLMDAPVPGGGNGRKSLAQADTSAPRDGKPASDGTAATAG